MYASISSLLIGISILLSGNGLLGTLLGVRATREGMADWAIGVVMSAYFFGFILGTHGCPRLIRRVGHIRTFAAMAAISASSAFAYALSVSTWSWGALRLVSGFCMVGLYMVIESWLNDRSPSTHRGRVFGLYVTVTLGATACGQYLLLLGPEGGPIGFGLATALFALGIVPVTLTDLAEPQPAETPQLGFGRLYDAAPLGVIGALAAGLTNSAFWGMGAVYAQRTGMSPAETAAFLSVTVLGGAILQWPIGKLSDRWDRRLVLAIVCAVACAVSISALNPAPTLRLLVFFLFGGLVFSVYSIAAAHVNDVLPPTEVLEAARGILLLFGLGATLGPALAGLTMDRLGPVGFLTYFAAAYLALGGFAFYRLQRRTGVPPEEQGPFVPMARMSPTALEMHPAVEAPADPPPAAHAGEI